MSQSGAAEIRLVLADVDGTLVTSEKALTERAIGAVHDWAVARLTQPVEGVTPFSLADPKGPNTPVEFVARGHIDYERLLRSVEND